MPFRRPLTSDEGLARLAWHVCPKGFFTCRSPSFYPRTKLPRRSSAGTREFRFGLLNGLLLPLFLLADCSARIQSDPELQYRCIKPVGPLRTVAFTMVSFQLKGSLVLEIPNQAGTIANVARAPSKPVKLKDPSIDLPPLLPPKIYSVAPKSAA